MFDPLLANGDGHTLLDDDARRGLKFDYITTRGELNEAEQANIIAAIATRRNPSFTRLLTDPYLCSLHGAMFNQVWTLAGTYRTSDTNIGCDWVQVTANVRALVDDVTYWIEHKTYSPLEIVVRFHHRMVQIHPFSNGNGRFSRIAANYLATSLDIPAPSWGSISGMTGEDMRARYIGALHDADRGDITSRLLFAMS